MYFWLGHQRRLVRVIDFYLEKKQFKKQNQRNNPKTKHTTNNKNQNQLLLTLQTKKTKNPKQNTLSEVQIIRI